MPGAKPPMGVRTITAREAASLLRAFWCAFEIDDKKHAATVTHSPFYPQWDVECSCGANGSFSLYDYPFWSTHSQKALADVFRGSAAELNPFWA